MHWKIYLFAFFYSPADILIYCTKSHSQKSIILLIVQLHSHTQK